VRKSISASEVSRESTLYFAPALFAGIVATVLVSGTTFTPTPAEAAKTSSPDRVALNEATVACKAKAKGQKISWLARRKFISSCVTETLKEHPSMDINQLHREPNVKGLPSSAE
jgi:hypothetical protein